MMAANSANVGRALAPCAVASCVTGLPSRWATTRSRNRVAHQDTRPLATTRDGRRAGSPLVTYPRALRREGAGAIGVRARLAAPGPHAPVLPVGCARQPAFPTPYSLHIGC